MGVFFYLNIRSRDDHRINVEKSKTIPGRHVITLTFKPFAR